MCLYGVKLPINLKTIWLTYTYFFYLKYFMRVSAHSFFHNDSSLPKFNPTRHIHMLNGIHSES